MMSIVKKAVRKPRITRHLPTVVLGKGLPDKLLVTHKWELVQDIASASGAMSTFRIACNGMFQPTISATHQPMYYDQISPLYNHYTVIGSKIRVTFFPKVASNGPGGAGLIIDDDANSTYTSVSELGEESKGKTAVIVGGAVLPTVLTHKWSAKRAFGGSVMSNNNLAGAPGSNPAELQYFVAAYQAFASATNTCTVRVQVEYIAMWTELKDIAQS